MSPKQLYSLGRFWTYSMIYGPGPGMPPFTSNTTNGSDSVESYWTRLATWWRSDPVLRFLTIVANFLETSLRSLSQWFARTLGARRRIGSHRGIGRATRKGSALLRAAREEAWAQYENFLLLKADPALVGAASIPGDRAYRKLAWSRLNHEAQTLIRAKAPVEDPYESVP